jgi:hypothetical protein
MCPARFCLTDWTASYPTALLGSKPPWHLPTSLFGDGQTNTGRTFQDDDRSFCIAASLLRQVLLPRALPVAHTVQDEQIVACVSCIIVNHAPIATRASRMTGRSCVTAMYLLKILGRPQSRLRGIPKKIPSVWPIRLFAFARVWKDCGYCSVPLD